MLRPTSRSRLWRSTTALVAVGVHALLAPSAHAQSRPATRPPFARIAWSAAAPDVHLRDAYEETASGDVVWIDERGVIERRRASDGTLVARLEEPDCYPQERVRVGDLLVVACAGGTGSAPNRRLVAFALRTSSIAWRQSVGASIIWPRAAIDAHTLIAVERGALPSDDRLRIVAVDLASGRLLYRGDGRLRGTPCAMREDIQTTADLVVVSACRSGIAAFSRRDGALRWNVDAPELRTVVRAGDTLAAWTDTGRVEGIDLRTGRRRPLVAETDPRAQAQPLVASPTGDVIVQRWGRELLSIDAEDGRIRWVNRLAYTAEAWARDGAIVTHGSDGVSVIDAATGVPRTRVMASAASEIVVTDTRIFALEHHDSRALTASPGLLHSTRIDGTQAWTAAIDAAPSSPLVVSRRAFVCSEAGELYAVDPETGALAWRADVGRDPNAYGTCEVITTGRGALTRRRGGFAFVAYDAPTYAPRPVRVVGRVVGDVPAAGARVWVGHRITRVARDRTFDVRVHAATALVVRIDPRDAGARCATAEPVTITVAPGRVARARLHLASDHCVCHDCD